MDVAAIQRAAELCAAEFPHNLNNNNNGGSAATVGECGFEKGKPLPCEFDANDATSQQQQQQQATKMSSSVASILDDTTPSDSGVQLLDSESSGLNESMISSAGGFEFDVGGTPPPAPASAVPGNKVEKEEGFHNNNNNNNNNNCERPMDVEAPEIQPVDGDELAAVGGKFAEITLNPVAQDAEEVGEGVEIDPAMTASQLPDELISSTCSTFDSENIVYRRRIKKAPISQTPKKRVSFHEDILKNTKTDNIHIEHGFITYKTGGSGKKGGKVGGRYSWCTDRVDGSGGGGGSAGFDDYGDEEACEGRQYVYRNACSDVLDYGKTDVFENVEDERNYVKYDNSGVFEYGPPERKLRPTTAAGYNLYKCSCSDSNSSLDSGEGNTATDQRSNYRQAKSNSCECIGSATGGAGGQVQRGGSARNLNSNSNNNNNNNVISDNCYYSEPSIEHLDEFNGNVMRDGNAEGCASGTTDQQQFVKSVWSKEKKPKSSCLKKTKRNSIYTNVVVPEYDLNRKVKKFNVHQRLSVIDNSRMIFGSLKDIFGIALPERGVPEGSEDLSSVRECIPETHDDQLTVDGDFTVVQKPKSFLSKSLDGGFNAQNGGSGGGRGRSSGAKKYVHNVDEQLRRKNDDDLYAPSRKNSVEEEQYPSDGHGTKTATREVNVPLPGPESNDVAYQQLPVQALQPIAGGGGAGSTVTSAYRNKFIINGESTVFEHTGVCYTFEDEQRLSRGIGGAEDDETKDLPVGETTGGSFIGKTQIKKKLSTIFQKMNVIGSSTTASTSRSGGDGDTEASDQSQTAPIIQRETQGTESTAKAITTNVMESSMISSCGSDHSDHSTVSSKVSGSTATSGGSRPVDDGGIVLHSPRSVATVSGVQPQPSSRHLSSPLRKKSLTTMRMEPARLRMSPDLFNVGAGSTARHLGTLDRQLVEEFDDILTVTTAVAEEPRLPQEDETMTPVEVTTEKDDLVIVDYPSISGTSSSTVQSPLTPRSSSEGFDEPLLEPQSKPPSNGTLATTSVAGSAGGHFSHPPRQTHHRGRYSQHGHNAMTSSTSSSTSTASKSSLINRFLRNVTQKKILEATIKQNPFFQSKLNGERKLFDNLVPRGVKPVNRELIEDLNAEIAMEIELSASGCQLDRVQLNDTYAQSAIGDCPLALGGVKFDGGGIGVGELPVDLFSSGGQRRLSIYRNDSEVLMKAFKLFNGYSREGYMTPVLVFLTDRTLYVTDQVRNRLCNKFVLPYAELDVILVGPYGNTVLLSNSARDMQQVLLAGGPYPAEGLVSSLELCARRGGSVLPAVGQLTLDHLAPLQAFVRDHSSVNREDSWKYYAVVNVPAGTLGTDETPLGPHIKGPLMHRRMSHAGFVDNWSAGYFLLKAGVLYLFGDASQKLPTWAVALAECQGARRSVSSGRPYCFELLLRTGALQLAAPDEYVASDWLQALVQAASGLFEVQERRRTLGCTLIMTSNHMLTLREDFSAPLRRSTACSSTSDITNSMYTPQSPVTTSPSKENINPNVQRKGSNVSSNNGAGLLQDNSSEISSVRSNSSTPTRNSNNAQLSGVDRRSNCSSTSTPTRASMLMQQANTSPARSLLSRTMTGAPSPSAIDFASAGGLREDKSYTNMSSFYGKNSGVEVLTCASIDEMAAVKIPAVASNWWCILEFECQEVRECSDDLVVFFSTSAEQSRFLSTLEAIWHAKKREPFPATIINSEDVVYDHCSKLFLEINRSWEPLLSAALGYPQ
ncbi:uncharacterized protein LOC126573589 [Anopheles aquasalis]|uniref:uncharacterized protein LOC126573589 n=1 Tax=Anopheles aquasalis TaxID=42839 RepID=UPI00215AC0AB|nr:uncharacterized protein LOC126573589 [Anopheles aquasalis]